MPFFDYNILHAYVSVYNALGGELAEDLSNALNQKGDGFDSDTLVFHFSQVLIQIEPGPFGDEIAVTFAIREVIDQVECLFPLVSLLKGKQLGLRLRLVLRWVIVPDKFHDEFIVSQTVYDEQLSVHNWVWTAASNLVLIRPTSEPLPLANEEVYPYLHLLEAQKVKFSVRFLGVKDQAMVYI